MYIIITLAIMCFLLIVLKIITDDMAIRLTALNFGKDYDEVKKIYKESKKRKKRKR